MYESKQMPLKERTDNVSNDVSEENRAGISAVMKTEYEGVGGLSFDDVRIHYHIQKPVRSQASATPRGNLTYIVRRQERELRRESGDEVRQKRGLLIPAGWENGLPENEEHGSQQPVVQGVFLRWMYDKDGRQYLKEVTDGGYHDFDTTKILWVGELFDLLTGIIDADLIGRLSREISGRLHQVKKEEDVRYILGSLHSSEAGERIVGALDHGCCNWLWSAAELVCKRLRGKPSAADRDAVSAAEGVKALVESRFSVSGADRTGAQEEMEEGRLGADVTDSQRYGEVMWKIDQLHQMIDRVSIIREPHKKQQLKQLIYYDILGYMRLQARFRNDFKMRQMPLKALQTHYEQAFQEQDAFAEAATASVEPAAEPNGLPTMYADEKSRQVPLPAMGELPTVIRNEEPISRRGSKVEGDVAKQILEEVKRAASREQLVIYRSMNSGEALSILQVFNTSKASELEQAVMSHSDAHPFDFHNIDKRANLGKHYGEYAQAVGYKGIRDGMANVLLAFILKPGAKQLLFSKSLLALNGDLRQVHEHFAQASENEGTAAGYIGVKDERPRGVNSYSLGVSQPKSAGTRTPSQLLLQLLIDRVEVRKIKYE